MGSSEISQDKSLIYFTRHRSNVEFQTCSSAIWCKFPTTLSAGMTRSRMCASRPCRKRPAPSATLWSRAWSPSWATPRGCSSSAGSAASSSRSPPRSWGWSRLPWGSSARPPSWTWPASAGSWTSSWTPKRPLRPGRGRRVNSASSCDERGDLWGQKGSMCWRGVIINNPSSIVLSEKPSLNFLLFLRGLMNH